MDHIKHALDNHYGMISIAQASALDAIFKEDPNYPTDSATIIEFINRQLNQLRLESDAKVTRYPISIQDKVYRIFDEEENKKEGVARVIILGKEGAALRINLAKKQSEQIDLYGFERGDIIYVKNCILNSLVGEVECTSSTLISRIFPSIEGIVDYGLIQEGDKNIDVIGNVVEIGPIRYVNKIGGQERIGVSSCVISSSKGSIDVSMWGRAAIKTAVMNVNDIIKIEFCSARKRLNKIEIYANERSRILINKGLKSRI